MKKIYQAFSLDLGSKAESPSGKIKMEKQN
jgi:hypothetical protein